LKNAGKRLVRSPKPIFYDIGVCRSYQGNFSATDGHLFENWLVSEIRKLCDVMPDKPSTYFWRTGGGAEVDLVIELEGLLLPIEIKRQKKLKLGHLRGLASFCGDYGERVPLAVVAYNGEEIEFLNDVIVAIPFQLLVSPFGG